MSMLPSFRGEFDKNMSDQDCKSAVELIRGVRGVLGVQFNAATKRLSATYTDPRALDEIRNIEGLKLDTRHRF